MAIQKRTEEKMKTLQEFITDFYAKEMRTPSLREMEEGTGIDRTTCSKLFKLLKDEKAFSGVKRVSRKIFAAGINDDGSKSYYEVGSVEVDEGYASGSGEETFILKRFKGASNTTIHNGDLILMQISEIEKKPGKGHR